MKFLASYIIALASASTSKNQLHLKVDESYGTEAYTDEYMEISRAMLETNGLHIHHHRVKSLIKKRTAEFRDHHKLKLPHNIQSLLREANDGDMKLADGAIGKARGILNGMMESAQDELDAKTMECKEFKERNRGTWNQVATDLKRLQQQITDLEGIKQESSSEIAISTGFVMSVEEEKEGEQVFYDNERQTDEDEMVWRQNDLKVAEFLLKLTKCKDEPKKMFLQMSSSPLKVQHCKEEKNDQVQQTVKFLDKKAHAAFLKMGKQGRRSVQKTILSALQLNSESAWVECAVEGGWCHCEGQVRYGAKEKFEYKNSAGDIKCNNKTFGDPIHGTRKYCHCKAAEKMEGTDEGSNKPASVRKQSKKCSLGRPDCGLLHDNMSLMWGGMKDAVDALDAKMRKAEKAWKKKLENWNDQISLATGNKETSQGHLAAAMAEQTADAGEQQKKQQEERRLEKEFKKGWGACVRDMNEILFTKFCGVKSVRGSLHKQGAVTPEMLQDCELGDWVAQPCSVECDDELKGGTQLMTREVIQKCNENGTKCARETWIKKCNQIPCPIDCVMENWSLWSSCTTDCGGGVMGRTRSVDDRPKNGGLFCDTQSEVVPCNTQSCNRDCELTHWKKRPCSTSCGGGWMIRKKHIIKPSRGKGKCAKAHSFERYGKKKCNTDPCNGDEECVAKQDIIFAVDGSGSVKEKGFKILRDFAAILAGMYRPSLEEYNMNEETFEWEQKNVTAAQIGVIQFGQGVMTDDNTVGGADIIHPLTNLTDEAIGAMEKMVHRRGFTNMAQAFMAADMVFLNGGRQHAQSVMIVISDGKPSFNYQTDVAVAKLRRKGVKVVMVVVKEFMKDKQKDLMKSWSSVPRSTNFIHIPGLKKLRKRMAFYAYHVLVRTCSKTVSLKKEMEEQERWEAASAMEELADFGNEKEGEGEVPAM